MLKTQLYEAIRRDVLGTLKSFGLARVKKLDYI